MFYSKCPCFILVKQNQWLICTQSFSFRGFFSWRKKSLLQQTSTLQVLSPLWTPCLFTNFWCCPLLLSSVSVSPDLSLPWWFLPSHTFQRMVSLWVSRCESGSGIGSACDKEWCLEGQGGVLVAKKHTVPGFLSQSGDSCLPPSRSWKESRNGTSSFQGHFQTFARASHAPGECFQTPGMSWFSLCRSRPQSKGQNMAGFFFPPILNVVSA